uniref:Cadherin related family member 4 n=1 Tax=Dromaius novaehollandiae TaxID=8790 RepID=A0A8C4K896_DRONO
LGLPRIVTVSEDTAPGTLVAKVTLACSNVSSNPRVMLARVEPSSPFDPNVTVHSVELGNPFNPIAISTNHTPASTFQAEVQPGGGARSHSQPCLCPYPHPYPQPYLYPCPYPHLCTDSCLCPLSSSPVPIPIVIPIPIPIPQTRGCCWQAGGPYSWLSPGLSPWCCLQVFRLEIVVTDRHGHNCSGAVTVELLPSPAPALFTVDEGEQVTGEIRSAHRLDLERFPQAAHTQLLVQAYDMLNPMDRATMTLNITVQRRSQQAPRCAPALYVYGAPWLCGAPLGGAPLVLWAPWLCWHLQLCGILWLCRTPPLCSPPGLRDLLAAVAVGFQLTATIVVTAGGRPPRSTRVPVLVTVTPVNEYTPACPDGTAFTVLETAAFGTAVGRIAGTDRDYPLNSIEYSLEGGLGSLGTALAGEIYVVGPLDYERQKSYRLTVKMTDTHNDLDPANRRSCLCDVAVHVPVCTPEVQELRIIAKPATRQPVTRLACQGSRNGATLSYAIIRGEEQLSCCDRHFRLEGNTLFHVPNGHAEPRTFVLLVEVWGGPSVPRRSTTVMLVVHVIPWTTTTLWKEPLVITRTEATWNPPAWFVAVLTVSGALLLATLGCMARTLLSRRGPPHHHPMAPWAAVFCFPQGSGLAWVWGMGEMGAGQREPCTTMAECCIPSPGMCRDSLFNSVTGVRCWI